MSIQNDPVLTMHDFLCFGFISQVALVFGLLGASISTIQIYIFPGCMLVVEATKMKDMKINGSLKPTAMYEPLPMALEKSNGINCVDAHPLSGIVTHENEVNDNIPLKYVPNDPESMYRHGMALIIFGGIISVVGTGTYIYSSIVA